MVSPELSECEGLDLTWLYHVKKSVVTRFCPVGMMESNLNFDYKSNRRLILIKVSDNTAN